MSWIKQANVKLESDGTIHGTQVKFMGKGGEEAIIPVSYVSFHLDVKTAVPVLSIGVLMPLVNIEIASELQARFVMFDTTKEEKRDSQGGI